MAASRRKFVQGAATLAAWVGTHRSLAQQDAMPGIKREQTADRNARTAAPTPTPPHVTRPMLHTLGLAPFVDALPVPEVIRPAQTNGTARTTLRMQEIHARVHRDVPETRLWSYGPHLAPPVIEARAGVPLEIAWVNDLPVRHFLPIDYSLHGSGHDVPDVRTVVHLHGARARSRDDGYPTDWYTPGHGRTCKYPMDQEATALWFHDHAMGLNRLNTYAGLFGMLLLRDQTEEALHLPTGKYEVPLFLFDRDYTADGQLFYDMSGDPASPWIPEFSADGLLVNGKIRPFHDVEPTLYRFRMLNTANSRFFLLSLSNGHPLTQIGSDQGLLEKPVEVQRIVLAPAERADVLLDFGALAGQSVRLRTGATDLLEFRVAAQTAGPVSAMPAAMPAALRTVRRMAEQTATRTRTVTLHEYKDDAGRSMVMLLNRKHWHDPTTDFVKLNSTEVWEFVNLTEDTHPMHVHLIRFQILDRRTFDTTEFLLNKRLVYLAAAVAPDANEMGWKDTVQCPPGTVTRIIGTFEGYMGKYLYHCHILEHEARDMMRPFEVVS